MKNDSIYVAVYTAVRSYVQPFTACPKADINAVAEDILEDLKDDGIFDYTDEVSVEIHEIELV